jgi:hypothetical protein
MLNPLGANTLKLRTRRRTSYATQIKTNLRKSAGERGRVVMLTIAWSRKCASTAVGIVLPLFVALVLILNGNTALAAESQCMGLAADGKARCTAPLITGYHYDLCSSSSLYIEQGLRDRCTAAVVGGYGIPITQQSTLQSLINCMGGQGSSTWMSSGSANGFFCGGTVAYKYSDQVVGISDMIPYGYGWLQPRRFKTAVCPFGYTGVGSDAGFPDYCIQPPKNCCLGTPNPMGITNGDHGRVEPDIAPTAASPLEFTRYYSSSGYYRPAAAASHPSTRPRSSTSTSAGTSFQDSATTGAIPTIAASSPRAAST